MGSENPRCLRRACWNRSRRGAAIGLLLLGCGLTACLQTPITYPEPRRDPADVARLRVVRGRIFELDGVAQDGSRFELLPGDHAFAVSFQLRGEELAPGVGEQYVGRLDCRGKAVFVAGGRYRLELAPSFASLRRANVTRHVHGIELIDEADGQHLLMDSSCGWR